MPNASSPKKDNVNTEASDADVGQEQSLDSEETTASERAATHDTSKKAEPQLKATDKADEESNESPDDESSDDESSEDESSEDESSEDIDSGLDEGSSSIQMALTEEIDRQKNTITRQLENIIELKSHVAEMEEELERSRARLRTMNQDFGRFRDRTKSESIKNRDESLAEILLKLLPIMDNLELARGHAESDKVEPTDESQTETDAAPEKATAELEGSSGIRQGIGITWKHFEQVLRGLGMHEVPSETAPFDPEVHEAMEVVIRPDLPDDVVVEVIQRGYFLKDRLLRPARVRVSRKTEPPKANPDSGMPLNQFNESMDIATAPSDTNLQDNEGASQENSQEEEVIFETNEEPSTEPPQKTAGTTKVAPRVFSIDLAEYGELGDIDFQIPDESQSSKVSAPPLSDQADDDYDDEEIGFDDVN